MNIVIIRNFFLCASILFCMNGLCFPDWFVKEKPLRYDAVLEVKKNKEMIVCALKNTPNTTGGVFMFYRIGQKITSVGDLAQAELFSFSMGSSNTAYCTLNPMTNGTYHLAACVFLSGSVSNQNYQLIAGNTPVVVSGIEPPAEIGEKESGEQTAETNDIVEPLLLIPERSGTEQYSNITREMYFHRELDQSGMLILNELMTHIRELQEDLKKVHVLLDDLNDTDTSALLLRYTGISTKIESLYVLFMTYGYRWEYIPKINAEYLALTADMISVQQKAIRIMREKLLPLK